MYAELGCPVSLNGQRCPWVLAYRKTLYKTFQYTVWQKLRTL